ncbi:FAD binding domain-containing protein [Seohaeicola zhoushanensis]|uniref:Oxidoreductase n=1 Tax=Seohaeicola zhoushanensis TaxID=1569283 RepID=A0A8J3MB92_9RHOB|nr:xanthine dehydrogenase family protein subunit M [Seohaeicola zhoushanensis]GHF74595.1 oxidoreductase [Seohaeicola zhoushanensis]
MNFASPRTIDEAVRLLAGVSGAGHVLAGGTDLVVQMTAGLRSPELVVDIKHIPELTGIREDADGFHLGAAVCGAALSEHAALKATWPGVVEAVDLIGSMQVQSRATPVGNLCNASPAADSLPALIAAGAEVSIIGPEGPRRVPVAEIPAGPGRTTLRKGEVITTIHLPPRPPRAADAYLRFIPRTEMDIAVVGSGVNLALGPDGRIAAARVALGAVAPTARLVPEAGAALVGTALDDTALDAATAAVRAACQPIDDKRGTAEYRTRVAGVIFRRAAAAALARARARSL